MGGGGYLTLKVFSQKWLYYVASTSTAAAGSPNLRLRDQSGRPLQQVLAQLAAKKKKKKTLR
eukprot:NODE_10484_length_214_cov_36.036364_g9869_i0.p1 GENE.NODE_10484_length_214_cov_36.036364_g9869_i0~~NODE_10484_length_214_cov_36.036364_g9869_i0.p1  ORF type:complete len:70 (-),score=27.17 NODE_10484_length_214_cov_36.036364_g9869_i0:3-188(-)